MSKLPRFERWSLIPERQDFGLVKYKAIGPEPRNLSWASRDPEPKLDQWSINRLLFSHVMFSKAVEVKPGIRGGVPVLRGTRISIAQIVGEIADGRSLADLSKALDLELGTLKELFEALSIQFDHPFVK